MDTIYKRLGEENLKLLVNYFYDHVFSSEIIGPLFKNDKEVIKHKQLLFLTQFLGGPGLYTELFGHPKMRMRHMPHSITEETKTEWLKCMHMAINKLNISDELKKEVYNCFPAIAQHMVNR